METLKQKTIRGGFARLCAQAANFLLRLGSFMVLARLLEPNDFGVVGMVTAFTGILTLFRDFGLSSAAVQRTTITEAQVSTLFWINIVVGALLGLISLAMAPAVAVFYHEPRLFAVTAILAVTFLFNAAGVQHSVLLQREMRFTALAVINTISLVISTAVGILGALAGFGYWALVALTVSSPFTSTLGLWFATGWIPGRPRQRSGIRSMMHFGGILTLNGLVVYLSNNLDKILLGRFWGVEALGIYGRAYQLVNIPTDNLNSAAGEIAFSALSRLQDDPGRLKTYFLKGYSLVLAMTLPITIACGCFASDIVLALLGQKWNATAPIFRLLAPTTLVFAIVNPLGWLIYSLGMPSRGLKMALVIAPLMIAGYAIGLPHGPNGVALAYSAVMLLWAIPAIIWAIKGTVFSFWDVFSTVVRPLAAGIAAGGVALVVRFLYGQYLPALPRLVLESTTMLVVFLALIFFVTGQREMYLDLLRGLLGGSAAREEKSLTAVKSA